MAARDKELSKLGHQPMTKPQIEKRKVHPQLIEKGMGLNSNLWKEVSLRAVPHWRELITTETSLTGWLEHINELE